MTDQQEIAILNPCEDAMQCADRRYLSNKRVGPYVVSIVLTVNVGEE